MQDRFVGDIGDFGKYGLLRALTGIYPEAEPRLSLGVVWYRNEGRVGSGGDGRYTGYLGKPRDYRSCDPRLFDGLKEIVEHTGRTLGAIRQSRLLGNAVFHEDPIPWARGARDEWLSTALKSTEKSALTFLDPDKGLASDSAPLNSLEHTQLHEVRPFVDRRQTVIIYHHLGRTFEGRGASHPVQLQGWAEWLQAHLALRRKPKVLWYRRGTARAYFVLPSEEHQETIDVRLDQFRRSSWYDLGHFSELRI